MKQCHCGHDENDHYSQDGGHTEYCNYCQCDEYIPESDYITPDITKDN